LTQNLKLDCRALLSSEKFKPQAVLSALSRVVPVASSTMKQLSVERDLLPDAKQIYSVTNTYTYTAEGTSLQLLLFLSIAELMN
jgi:hypothetical protein